MKKILLILGLALLIVSTNELYAWTEPTVAPPGGNVLAPLRNPITENLTMSGRWIVPYSGVWGAGNFEVHNTSWTGPSQNSNYGGIIGGLMYAYAGINSGGSTGSEAGTGDLYVRNTSMLMGNVGIGTTNPGAKLDVLGDVAASGSVYWGDSGSRTEPKDNAGTVASKSGFFETSSPVNYYAGASSWQHLIESRHSNNTNNYALQIAGSFFDQELYFRKTNNSPSTTWNKFVYANSAGNVGIGTNNPTSQLDVAGSAEIAGSLTIGSVTLGSFSNTLNLGGASLSLVSGLNVSGAATANTIIGNNTSGATSMAGVRGEATSGGIGVYGINTSAAGYGIYCHSGRTAGCGGNRTWTNASDIRLKENIKTITSGLDKVMQLRGVQYEWRDDETNDKSVGFIAQEVMEVVPEVVSLNADGYYSISESSINAVLVEAMKELKAENDDLRERIEKLEDRIK